MTIFISIFAPKPTNPCTQNLHHCHFLSFQTPPFLPPLPSTKPPKAPKLSHPIDPSLHQKFVQKLLEPSLSTPTKPPLPTTKYTPLEQQVLDLKQKYPDVLLMVEVGYRYRFFGEDAEIASRVLGIYSHVDHNFLTVSIPTFRLNVHVRRLVSAGFNVGVVKQTETAAIKAHGSNKPGPFCRGLSALYTKATLEAAEDVGGGEEECGSCNNYLVCVVEKRISVDNGESCGVGGGFDVKIGIVAVEVSTGDVVHGEFNDNFMRAGLEAMILSMSPAELLLGYPLSKQTKKRIMSLPDLVVQALASTIRHLKQFGFEIKNPVYGSFISVLFKQHEDDMILSANSLQQLEVLNNHSDGSESGSLLHTMNHTLTIFGSRLLRRWVSHPLCDRNMISVGLDEGDSGVTYVQPEVNYLLSSVLTTLGKVTRYSTWTNKNFPPDGHCI